MIDTHAGSAPLAPGLRLVPRAGPSLAMSRRGLRLQVPLRSGLALWQMRKTALHIESHLASKITIEGLATLVGLSRFHFSRAFRDSFGDSPHRHVCKQRVARSQSLMLTTDSALAEIAFDCGLADQSHFVKLFRRFVGTTPGAWRRARIAPKGAF
jgi:AraC family transcriptional regulator